MTIAASRRIGGDRARVTAEAPDHPGRIMVELRALTKVAEQAAADTVGIDRGKISVTVAEAGGSLGLAVSTPLPVPSLDDTAAIRGGRPVLERVEALQTSLQREVSRLTGRDVTRINVTVTGAVINQTRRVQ